MPNRINMMWVYKQRRLCGRTVNPFSWPESPHYYFKSQWNHSLAPKATCKSHARSGNRSWYNSIDMVGNVILILNKTSTHRTVGVLTVCTVCTTGTSVDMWISSVLEVIRETKMTSSHVQMYVEFENIIHTIKLQYRIIILYFSVHNLLLTITFVWTFQTYCMYIHKIVLDNE